MQKKKTKNLSSSSSDYKMGTQLTIPRSRNGCCGINRGKRMTMETADAPATAVTKREFQRETKRQEGDPIKAHARAE